ncbi:Fc.00g020920.m01.CDS01 [Cosmosporella sp. VM-42]
MDGELQGKLTLKASTRLPCVRWLGGSPSTPGYPLEGGGGWTGGACVLCD